MSDKEVAGRRGLNAEVTSFSNSNVSMIMFQFRRSVPTRGDLVSAELLEMITIVGTVTQLMSFEIMFRAHEQYVSFQYLDLSLFYVHS